MSKLASQDQSHIAAISATLSSTLVDTFVVYALAGFAASAFYFYFYFYFSNILRRMLFWPGG